MAPGVWDALVMDPALAGAVERIARRAGLTPDHADDVLQEVRLRALRGDLGRPPAERTTALQLLRGTARNVARERARAQTRSGRQRDDPDVCLSVRPAAAGLAGDLQALAEVLREKGAGLTVAQREALAAAMAGLGPRPAARRLRISPTCYAERLTRAIRHLRGESGQPPSNAPLPADLGDDEGIPATWRTAIVLRALGQGYAEIGRHIGRTEEATRALLRRLRKRFGSA